MKATMKVLWALAAIAFSYTTYAQDLIIYRNGDELNVKVTEVGIDNIKYKRTDNPEGPAYEVRKGELFMIKYANGTKDVFKATAPTPPPSIGSSPSTFGFEKYKPLENDYDKYMRIYNRRKLKGTICTSIGVPFVVLGISLVAGGTSANERYYANYSYNYNNGYYYNNYYGDRGIGAITAGSIILAAGIPLTIVGAVQLGTSNKYLRKALEARPTLSFAPSVEPIKPVGNIGGSQMGLAMRLSF